MKNEPTRHAEGALAESERKWAQVVASHVTADDIEAGERVIDGWVLEADPDRAQRFAAILWRCHVAIMQRHGFRVHVRASGRTTLRWVA